MAKTWLAKPGGMMNMLLMGAEKVSIHVFYFCLQ